MTGSGSSVATMGGGGATPVASRTTRVNGGTSPRARREKSVASASFSSPRIEQQMQPLSSSTVCASTSPTSATNTQQERAPPAPTRMMVRGARGSPPLSSPLEHVGEQGGLAAAEK